jgi:predicted HTH domain antitoxin
MINWKIVMTFPISRKEELRMKLMEEAKENDQLNLKALLGLGVYESEDEFVHESLTKLLKNNKELRLKLAIYRYQTEDISIGKAAEIAGIYWEDMKNALIENGVTPELGPETIEEARQEILSARRMISEDNFK